MGKCKVCGAQTEKIAQIYIGNPEFCPDSQLTHYTYQRHTEYFCQSCVDAYMNEGGVLKSVGFYLGLQLCWLSVIKSGLLSPVGIFAAVIAVFGLFRLSVLGGKWIYCRIFPNQPLSAFLSGKADPEEAASDLYKATVEKEEKAYGRRVESLREYRRAHPL